MRVSTRIALMPAAVLLAAVAAGTQHPAAAAYNLPWCAIYYEGNVTSCAYTSWEQCFATVAGPVGGHCTLNPAYPPPPPYGERHRGKRVSRHQ
jgi:hypothetical protein